MIAYLGKELPEGYYNMILSKWLRTLKYGNDFFRLADQNSYFYNYQKYLKNILARPQCIIRLAVLTESPDVCLGFSVSEPDVVHYCWVHKDNRKIGISKALLNFPFSFISHLTTQGMAIWHKRYPEAIFDPFL